MPTYSQAGRLIAVTTPLGADKLLLEKLRSEEALSEPFRLTLEVLCLRSDAFDFDALLGQPATAKVELPDALVPLPTTASWPRSRRPTRCRAATGCRCCAIASPWCPSCGCLA